MLKQSLYKISQVLSNSISEKVPLNQLFENEDLQNKLHADSNQLTISDLQCNASTILYNRH